MDDLFKDILARYGLHGLIIAYLTWNFFQEWREERKENLEIEAKKKSGEWVSYEDVKVLQKKVNTLEIYSRELMGNFTKQENMLSNHFEKEAKEDIANAQLRTEFDNHKSLMTVQTDHIFSQLKSLHEKFDSKFDLLTKMIVERK